MSGGYQQDSDIAELRGAIHKGDHSDIQILAVTGIDVNARDTNDETALHMAAYINDGASARELINFGADLHVQNKTGHTPLHVAAAWGSGDVVKILLREDVDTAVKTYFTGMTPLHLASQNGHTEIVRLLLKYNPDTSPVDLINKTARYYAANEEIRELLDYPARAASSYRANTHTDTNKSSAAMQGDNQAGNQTGTQFEDTEEGNQAKKSPDIMRKQLQPVNHKIKFSKLHKKRMQLNVFDRLTRRKSQIL